MGGNGGGTERPARGGTALGPATGRTGPRSEPIWPFGGALVRVTVATGMAIFLLSEAEVGALASARGESGASTSAGSLIAPAGRLEERVVSGRLGSGGGFDVRTAGGGGLFGRLVPGAERCGGVPARTDTGAGWRAGGALAVFRGGAAEPGSGGGALTGR